MTFDGFVGRSKNNMRRVWTGVLMTRIFGASITFALVALCAPAFAADLPEVKVTASNTVPECATPGRLTAYLKARNPRLNARFEELATLYMRHGEALGIRWDVAFFQMILETGALRFTGDVRPDQNNFAGLGASGGGAHGERFADISSGVKAHLQHLLMYAGEHIDDPVAERTRKVQEWGVLTKWQQSIRGPMTYTLVARQWAPTSRNYVRDITAISDDFYSNYCNASDPNPGMVQEARRDSAGGKTQVAAAAPAADAAGSSGAEIAKRNIEEERKQGAPLRSLGANMLASSVSSSASAEPLDDAPPVTLLNSNPGAAAPAAGATANPKAASATKAVAKADAKADAKDAAKTAPGSDAKSAQKSADVQTAALGSAATQMKTPSAKSSKCKVWTASYGGQRAVIIKATGNGTVNYTVLDVTEANEKREIDAYIAAYAKGGEKLASFPSQTKALSRAFELCPEG